MPLLQLPFFRSKEDWLGSACKLSNTPFLLLKTAVQQILDTSFPLKLSILLAKYHSHNICPILSYSISATGVVKGTKRETGFSSHTCLCHILVPYKLLFNAWHTLEESENENSRETLQKVLTQWTQNQRKTLVLETKQNSEQSLRKCSSLLTCANRPCSFSLFIQSFRCVQKCTMGKMCQTNKSLLQRSTIKIHRRGPILNKTRQCMG